jgi:hypothetical protein
MGSFAYAYREVTAKPLGYVKIMFYFLVMVALSILAPAGGVGIFSLVMSYSSLQSTILSLAGMVVYAAAFLLLFCGSYGALLAAIDARRTGRQMGLDEMIAYAMGNSFKLALLKGLEIAIIGFFVAVIFGLAYIAGFDMTRKLYIGIAMVAVAIPAVIVKYLLSLSTVSFVKSGGVMRSIGKSVKITVFRAMNYLPVCLLVCLVVTTLFIPLLNIATFFLLYPVALLALIKEYEKLLL